MLTYIKVCSENTGPGHPIVQDTLGCGWHMCIIYRGAIPVLLDKLKRVDNKNKLIAIRIIKGFRIISHDALCVISSIL